MHHTSLKGNIGELKFATRALEKGYEPFFPVYEDGKIDLIIYKHSNLLKLQIKYVSLRDGVIKVPCFSNASGKQTTHYLDGVIDGIGVYNPDRDECFLIPKDEIKKRWIHLRVRPPRNNQKKINWAKDYLF